LLIRRHFFFVPFAGSSLQFPPFLFHFLLSSQFPFFFRPRPCAVSNFLPAPQMFVLVCAPVLLQPIAFPFDPSVLERALFLSFLPSPQPTLVQKYPPVRGSEFCRYPSSGAPYETSSPPPISPGVFQLTLQFDLSPAAPPERVVSRRSASQFRPLPPLFLSSLLLCF